MWIKIVQERHASFEPSQVSRSVETWGLAKCVMVPAGFFISVKMEGFNGFIVITFTGHRREMGLGALKDISLK